MLDKKLLIELQEYVDNHINMLAFSKMEESISYELHNIALENFIEKKRQPAFHKTLFDFIDKKGATDVDIYKKAGIDRRHFSKIRSNPGYRPSKNTAVALALALELDKKHTDKLLGAAGYSLSDSDTFDLVIQFCLEKEIYDLHEVNQALDYFSLKPLIGVLV
jgi:hypothetical protein